MSPRVSECSAVDVDSHSFNASNHPYSDILKKIQGSTTILRGGNISDHDQNSAILNDYVFKQELDVNNPALSCHVVVHMPPEIILE